MPRKMGEEERFWVVLVIFFLLFFAFLLEVQGWAFFNTNIVKALSKYAVSKRGETERKRQHSQRERESIKIKCVLGTINSCTSKTQTHNNYIDIYIYMHVRGK